jgi:beta-ribofuranosylaminobenzene 5'-phosphate synthase
MMSAMPDSIIVTTGARLHFGFFAHHAATTGAAEFGNGLERSNYGGIGMMIDSPSVVIAASKSDRDSVIGRDLTPQETAWSESIVARAVAEYRRSCPADHQPPPCAIAVRRVIPSHCGLGSGTQLGLAIAQALALLAGDGQADACMLARRVGRGKRSAIGIHGFARGGFLVDGGKRSADEIGALVARADIPHDWRLLLVTAGDSSVAGLAGQEEVAALEKLPGMPTSFTERLCRLAFLEMIPALAQSDCDWFGEALFQFGRAVGDYFRPVQGGAYADPLMTDLVGWLRSEGVRGIAQTSWGPTIAVCCQSAPAAESLRDRILAEERFKRCRMQIAAPLNTGAAIQL